jgi:peptidoglycan-N-acetylglucosamine deacetylase
MTIEIAKLIVFSFVGIALILIVLIAIQKVANKRTKFLQGQARDYLFKIYFDHEPVKMPLTNRFFFDAYIDVETQVEIDAFVRDEVVSDIRETRFCKGQIKKLSSRNTYIRRRAIFYVSALKTEESKTLLTNLLKKETNASVRFYIIYALKDVINEDIFKLIVESLIHADPSYQRWLHALLNNNYNKISPFVDAYFKDIRLEVRKMLIHLATYNLDPKLKDFAMRLFKESLYEPEIRLAALTAVATTYPQEVANDDFCKNQEDPIKRIAILAASNMVTQEMVDHLLRSIDGTPLDSDRVKALSRIVYDSKTLLLYILDYFNTAQNDFQKNAIARVLAHQIDYLMLKIKSKEYAYISQIIERMMVLNIIEDFIDFMNHNKDSEIERQMIGLIKKHAWRDNYLMEEFSIYLKQDILSKMGMIKKSQPVTKREKSPIEKRKTVWILFWSIFAILFFPALYFITRSTMILNGEVKIFEFMIVNINYYLMIYFLSINTIYLILLVISVKGSEERISMWQIKKQTLLFERDLLPSISIIAPAYNEEKTIINSVTSLLNLKYPKYEVVVVNDGSKDQTIDVLIDHFKLERKHPFFKLQLKTKMLRGVYVNKHIPNLIVVDKQNGGKADALNLGINVAKSDYVCGIDADSLLEEDALLKLMSITLDDTTEHIALGGNIVPVNGCIVDKGKIEKPGLGKNGLVRFQTLEYLRAFTTGRIGWSKLKSLLIVSGAFGLFQRKSIMETGGYLTISGDLKKDTVGEDMELVVRLTYQALTKNKKYRVEYVHHANCYTELPSDLGSFLKQRNRWQRGLLDILSYHRKLLFNPTYKQPGMIAFPYFFIFEMMGPFFETVGYLALLIGLILGILNTPLVIILLVVTIGYGIVISLFSLYIAERKTVFYSNKETLILVMMAIIENFGYRQFVSLHRIVSTFSALRENHVWGSQKRQGFQKK